MPALLRGADLRLQLLDVALDALLLVADVALLRRRVVLRRAVADPAAEPRLSKLLHFF